MQRAYGRAGACDLAWVGSLRPTPMGSKTGRAKWHNLVRFGPHSSAARAVTMEHAGRPIEILLVEDSPGDVRLTIEALKDGKVHNNLNLVSDVVDALALLRRAGKYAE